MNIRLEEGEALVVAAAYFNQEFQENIKRRWSPSSQSILDLIEHLQKCTQTGL